jgi:hypothetical protein
MARVVTIRVCGQNERLVQFDGAAVLESELQASLPYLTPNQWQAVSPWLAGMMQWVTFGERNANTGLLRAGAVGNAEG